MEFNISEPKPIIANEGDIILAKKDDQQFYFIVYYFGSENAGVVDLEVGEAFDFNYCDGEFESVLDFVRNKLEMEIVDIIPNSEIVISRKTKEE